jgi:hypothetical protein
MNVQQIETKIGGLRQTYFGCAIVYLAFQRFQATAIQVEQRQIGSFVGKRQRRCPSDSATSTTIARKSHERFGSGDFRAKPFCNRAESGASAPM